MSSTASILPPLQGLIDQAPSGTNPYDWWAALLYAKAYPGLAPKSIPFFWIVAVIAFLNIPITIFTLIVKYRSEGGISYYKLREHASGGRYICLNATSVFLTCHILTCMVFTTYPILHLYRYNAPGFAWQDLTWAAFMWLAPYTELLLTSLGVLYAILVAPSPLAYARRAPSDGHLVPHPPPLSRVPCWFLNAFIFIAPIATCIAVLVPGIHLVKAVKHLELFSIQVFENILVFSADYEKGITPAVADQAAFLQSLVAIEGLTAEAAHYWRPLYGVWLGFVAVAFVLAFVAFFVIQRVTRTRLQLAHQQFGESENENENANDSGNFELDEIQKWDKQAGAAHAGLKKGGSSSHKVAAAVKQARWEHYSLSTQFAAGAILLLTCDVVLFFDTIVGYKVHSDRDLLAACVLLPPFAYLAQSSVSVILTLIRSIQGKAHSQFGGPTTSSSPRSARTGVNHVRTDSDVSMLDKKSPSSAYLNHNYTMNPYHTHKTSHSHSGAIFVTSLPRHNSFPVSPSMIHQIQISQTVEMKEDTPSIAESIMKPRSPSRSESVLLDYEQESDPSVRHNLSQQELAYGRAL